jgi:hypothetical protein
MALFTNCNKLDIPYHDEFRGDMVVVHTTQRTIENYSAQKKAGARA